MKKKKGFNLRNICGENVIVSEGLANIDFSRIISMNESAAYLWKKVGTDSFDAKRLQQLLLEEYEVDEATALNDAEQLCRKWVEAGIVEQ